MNSNFFGVLQFSTGVHTPEAAAAHVSRANFSKVGHASTTNLAAVAWRGLFLWRRRDCILRRQRGDGSLPVEEFLFLKEVLVAIGLALVSDTSKAACSTFPVIF